MERLYTVEAFRYVDQRLVMDASWNQLSETAASELCARWSSDKAGVVSYWLDEHGTPRVSFMHGDVPDAFR